MSEKKKRARRKRKVRSQVRIPVRRSGGLGGEGYTSRSAESRRWHLAAVVRREGHATAVRRLVALRTLGRRSMSPEKLARIESDIRWLRRRREKQR